MLRKSTVPHITTCRLRRTVVLSLFLHVPLLSLSILNARYKSRLFFRIIIHSSTDQITHVHRGMVVKTSNPNL